MGWANCGNDSQGRPIGYAVEATCDHPGCKTKIDRGLAYACGGMHGDSDGCEKYFCTEHLQYLSTNVSGFTSDQVCADCFAIVSAECGPICPECEGDGRVGWGGKGVCKTCEGIGRATLRGESDE